MGNKSSASKAESKNDLGDDDDMDMEVPEGANKPSYYTMMKQAYQSLVNAIIRPPRSDYETSQLGPSTFQFCGKTFQRTDFELTNPRNLKFVCSMWEPVAADRPNKVLPCVIYMHGNSSSRLEALSSLSLVLSLGATLLCLDFCGSGKSEGEYVTLGYFEKDDLDVVIQHLRDTGTTSTIALWGRSMGAATALLHGERDPSIAGMVLDSAFADLVMLSEELVDKGREKGLFAPGVLVKLALRFVRSSVMKQAGFDIRLLSPIEHADKCFIPAMFIAAEGDGFVGKQHSEKIFAKYGGDKNIVLVEGDHNSARPLFLYDSVSIFLVNTLQIPDDWILPEGQNFIRKYPWTYRARQGKSKLPPQLAVQFEPTVLINDDDDMTEEERQQLNDLLTLSLLESQEAAVKSYSHEKVEIAPNMDTDAEMQVEVQAALFNMLSGGGTVAKAGKGSNRSGKPNTPIMKAELNNDDNDPVPTNTSHNSIKRHTANGKHQLAFSMDEVESESGSLPSASRHSSGITSETTTPMNANSGSFFNSPSRIHPLALANKNYGKDSSFNKVFGSFHDKEDEQELEGSTESAKMASKIEKQIIENNTKLNSASSASAEEDLGIKKTETLSEFDLNDSIEYDMSTIKFHSKSKTIDIAEPTEIPEITADDEYGFDAYTSSNKLK